MQFFRFTPVSISSKINKGSLSDLARIVLSESIMRDTSPPEATLVRGFTSSPAFVEI
ncbi:MAG: hypothetical protein MZV64_64340 [Ignavibacteriales bacterium]|nr:hypothetical protein [Ignavibacteriales bacterium]